MTILLTGPTGFVGRRLLRELLARGSRVRCLARNPEALAGTSAEVVGGDLLLPDSLADALRGVEVAVYLVHSMQGERDFEAKDRQAARNFGRAALAAGVRRIVYLGGLGRSGPGLSRHLRSRQEVGEELRASGVPVIELRASIVIGCGSASFEMIRALVERLPVMITPRWVDTPSQPIGVGDLMRCLLAAIDLPPVENLVLEIGGADRVSYGQIMEAYAHRRGLRRLMIKVPVLTPHLSSLWLSLVTPFHARVGRSLVDSLRNETVVDDPRGLEVLGVRPAGISEAVAAALEEEEAAFRASPWSRLAKPPPHYLLERRRLDLAASRERVFRVVAGLGGRNGWGCADGLWRLRGALDRAVGGVGLRRSRAPRGPLRVGDALDFWRIEELDPGRRLRLAAEMRVPGRAWLEFEVEDTPAGARLHQTAVFQPRGLLGLAYWYALLPMHRIVFRRMLQAIKVDPSLLVVHHPPS